MNYPNGLKKPIKDINSKKELTYLSHKNRGMDLENELNITNQYYRDINKAFIYKKPTPIKITKVDYPSKNKKIIKEAFFEAPSTTDYNGLYKGKYIDFEAKETKSKTSFNLNNIHNHQIKHLININNNGGISFLIISFVTLNEIYLLTTNEFIEYINNNTNKKSIPYTYIKEKGYLLKQEYNPRIDYLKIVDILIGGN